MCPRRCSSPIASVLVVLSCAPAPSLPRPATARAPELEIRDLMPEYWRWWSDVERQSPEQQAESFWATMAAAHPELYTPSVMGPWFADQPAARAKVRRYFEEMPGYLEGVRSTSEHLPELLRRGYAEFRRHFPDLRWSGPVDIIPSLLNFDGATRPVNGTTHLLFAPDGISRWHRADGLCAFFAHEFFHLYHQQFLPEATAPSRDPLWRALWGEGLAVYVSGQLCPGTGEDALLMSATLASETRPVLPRVVEEVRAALGSTDEKRYWRFFGGKPTGVPARAGYYVGYLVARRAARSRSLEQLAHLDAATAEALVESGLEELIR